MCATQECFKKLSIVKPGISGTCCEPKNMPINARVVVFSLVISLLSKIILPDFIVYDGFPAIVFASVDLPEPLCPDNKTREPVSIFNDIFFNNSRSDNVTVKFFISSIVNPLIMPFVLIVLILPEIPLAVLIVQALLLRRL